MISLQSTTTFTSSNTAFADPDWRGDQGCVGEATPNLRPVASLIDQERRLEDWIRGGSCYGWLNAYQARRAAFELEAIRAERRRGPLADHARRGVQSRLDRLGEVIDQARAVSRR
jgi:hypothetical protein